MTRPSQEQRVLAMLERAGLAGICSLEFYRGDEHGPMPNARNRIWERHGGLIAGGYHVESFPCPDEHGQAGYFRYVLIHGPERQCAHCPWRPAQLTIAAIG